MIRLQTPVIDEKCNVNISFSDRIMMLGSCFTDNIGKQLEAFGFDVCINPFGTLYNPISILQSIRKLVDDKPFTEEDCTDMGAGSGLICSFSHHTSFARKDSARFLADANEALEKARKHFRESNKVIITLGTSWCFRHIGKGMIVSNCLKRPGYEFTRERLTVEETVTALKEIVDICTSGQAGTIKDIIFTVSPIRHFKDGAHGNQLSKASLLIGVNETGAEYFPAYEIMMDELRDYRFYAEDMCHPSAQAVNYIGERFLAWALPASELDRLKENIRAFRHGCHISK
jgi:hypothetical protein